MGQTTSTDDETPAQENGPRTPSVDFTAPDHKFELDTNGVVSDHDPANIGKLDTRADRSAQARGATTSPVTRVRVLYGNDQQLFRLMHNETFSQLLHECAHHWNIFHRLPTLEFRDTDGSIWPSAGIVALETAVDAPNVLPASDNAPESSVIPSVYLIDRFTQPSVHVSMNPTFSTVITANTSTASVPPSPQRRLTNGISSSTTTKRKLVLKRTNPPTVLSDTSSENIFHGTDEFSSDEEFERKSAIGGSPNMPASWNLTEFREADLENLSADQPASGSGPKAPSNAGSVPETIIHVSSSGAIPSVLSDMSVPVTVSMDNTTGSDVRRKEGSLMPFPLKRMASRRKSGVRLIRENSLLCLMEEYDDQITYQKGFRLKQTRLAWKTPPSTVLVIKKPGNETIARHTATMIAWLHNERKMKVLVEPSVERELTAVMAESTAQAGDICRHANQFAAFTEEERQQLDKIVDFIICLGGDGTILWANSLFHQGAPPIISFALGSLGFLTPFDFKDFQRDIDSVIAGECFLTLRSRLLCKIYAQTGTNIGEYRCTNEYQVLNEVVIDRGPCAYLCNLECYCDGQMFTTIQADGVIVASATGSTAYSLSAGGTMVHPVVPCICFTPICPHSLSCRPLMFPEVVTLKIKVPMSARGSAWVSYDGQERRELKRGDYVTIRTSKWPFPCINKTDHIGDWFKSLAECLHFNHRKVQEAL